MKPLMLSAWNARVWALPHGHEDAQPEGDRDDGADADGPMLLVPLRTSVKLAMHLRSMDNDEETTELRERGAHVVLRGNEEKVPVRGARNKHVADARAYLPLIHDMPRLIAEVTKLGPSACSACAHITDSSSIAP